MPIERRPIHPLPLTYRPLGGTEYRVKDGDTWITVARYYNNMDVQRLIFFNFKTTKPDEVNWYLRRITGCNVPSPDGLNWTFSNSANPGLISIPAMEANDWEGDPFGDTLTVKRGFSPLSHEFQEPSTPLDTLGKIFDALQMLDLAIAVIGGALAVEAIMVSIGLVTGPIAPLVAVAAPHEAAIHELRMDQIRSGLALGAVLGADERPLSYVRANGYFKLSPVASLYPSRGIELQNLFNKSVIAGHKHGSTFTRPARRKLFDLLGSQIPEYKRSQFGDDPDNWSDQTWWQYYIICAGIYQRKFFPR